MEIKYQKHISVNRINKIKNYRKLNSRLTSKLLLINSSLNTSSINLTNNL